MKTQIGIALALLAVGPSSALAQGSSSSSSGGSQTPSIPTNYQVPVGTQIDYVIDGRVDCGGGPLPAGVHPVEYALEVLLPCHPDHPFPDGSGVAVILPAGQYDDFGINASSGESSGTPYRIDNNGTWGDIFIHLMGPHATYDGLNTEPTLIIEPSGFNQLGATTITIYPDQDWPARLAFHSIRINSAGQRCVSHSNKDTIDPATPFTPPGLRSPLGSQLHFYNCKLGSSPKAPQPVNGVSTGFDSEWGVHTFWTAPYFRNCAFDFIDIEEHAVYAHNQTPYLSGMRNCKLRGIGAQIWQETCRDAVHPTSAEWNTDQNGTYEGEWPGHGTTLLKKVQCDNEFGLTSRNASAAFALYATGRTIKVLDCEIRNDRPGTLRVPRPGGGAPTLAENQANSLIKAGPNTYIKVDDNGTDVNYHRERGKFPFYSDDPVTNPDPFLFKDITLRGNTFVIGSSGSVEMAQIASIEGRLTVEDNGIYYGPGATPGTQGENGAQWRLAEENRNGNSNPTYGSATSDVGLVIWRNNNTGTALTRALEAFPDMTAVQQASNPVVLEGCAATGQAGVFAGRISNQIIRAFEEYPNDNDPN